MMFFAKLVFLIVPAFAKPTISCSYLLHTVRNAEIRYDAYYENPFEMRQTAANRSVGTATFQDGSWLTVEALLENGSIFVKARSGVADAVRRHLRAHARLTESPHIYQIERFEDVSESSTELQYAQFKITCKVQ